MPLTQRALIELIAITAAIAVLLALAYQVIAPFLVALAWAGILVLVTWKPYERLARLVHSRWLAATLIVLVLGSVLVVPLVFAGIELSSRIDAIGTWYQEKMATGWPPVPHWIANLPLVGPRDEPFWNGPGHRAPAPVRQGTGTGRAADRAPAQGCRCSWPGAPPGGVEPGVCIVFLCRRRAPVPLAVCPRVADRGSAGQGAAGCGGRDRDRRRVRHRRHRARAGDPGVSRVLDRGGALCAQLRPRVRRPRACPGWTSPDRAAPGGLVISTGPDGVGHLPGRLDARRGRHDRQRAQAVADRQTQQPACRADPDRRRRRRAGLGRTGHVPRPDPARGLSQRAGALGLPGKGCADPRPAQRVRKGAAIGESVGQ